MHLNKEVKAVQENDKYIPTSAEKRILEVALNPESFSMSIKDRCKAAQTSRETWYKAMAKKPFTDLLNTLTMDMLKGKMSTVVNATYKFATTDSRCASDRKILLTMAGMYTDKQEIDNNHSGTISIKLEGELEEWAK